MSLADFINRVKSGQGVSFTQTMAIIDEYYIYQATAFHNGLGSDRLSNAAGSNEGSCKIFAFARLHNLDKQQTLQLFGDYYQQVLAAPNGADHGNIRNFMRYGWDGIAFEGIALTAKQPEN